MVELEGEQAGVEHAAVRVEGEDVGSRWHALRGRDDLHAWHVVHHGLVQKLDGGSGWTAVVGRQWLDGSGWMAVVGWHWLDGSGWMAVVGWQWLDGSGWTAVVGASRQRQGGKQAAGKGEHATGNRQQRKVHGKEAGGAEGEVRGVQAFGGGGAGEG